jgi:hypothetical protein
MPPWERAELRWPRCSEVHTNSDYGYLSPSTRPMIVNPLFVFVVV